MAQMQGSARCETRIEAQLWRIARPATDCGKILYYFEFLNVDQNAIRKDARESMSCTSATLERTSEESNLSSAQACSTNWALPTVSWKVLVRICWYVVILEVLRDTLPLP